MKYEYIRKQDAVEAVRQAVIRGYCTDYGVIDSDVVYEVLDGVELADVVPVVHGRWEHGKCNLCGEHAPYWCLATTYYESMYCPNCGAKMDGGE